MTEAILEDTSLDTTMHRVFLSSIDEVVEHVRAADTLGLGFRVESYNVASSEDPDGGPTEYEFTLLSEQPVHTESEL